jgi:hypothetical protein
LLSSRGIEKKGLKALKEFSNGLFFFWRLFLRKIGLRPITLLVKPPAKE